MQTLSDDTRRRPSAGGRDPHRRGAYAVAVAVGMAAVFLALLAPLAATGTAAAQQRTTATGGSAAPTASAELLATRREAEVARTRLERFVATLNDRQATAATYDTLVHLQRALLDLQTRASLLEDRIRYRVAEQRARQEQPRSEPDGWFGVTVETTSIATQRDGGVIVSSEYPRVASVEPGSPAARAGLMAGDRLLTIRNVDLRRQALEALDLNVLLRPGAIVPVRIDRAGAIRQMTVAITARPATFAPGTRVQMLSISPEPPRSAGEAVRVIVRTPGGTASSGGISPVLAPSPASYLFLNDGNVAAVGGAELMRLTEALRATLHVPNGLYVISVAPRTPAERAGMRAGDVLMRANGTILNAPADFFRIVRAQSDGRVSLALRRGKKQLSVVMEW